MENTPNWKHQLLRVLSERRNTSEQRSFIIPYKYFTVIAYWEERSFKNVVCKFQISVTDKLAVRGNAEPSQLSSTCTPPSLTLSKQERSALAACDSSQFLPLLAPCCHRSEHNTQPGASSAVERCDTSSKATIRRLPVGHPTPTSGQTPAGCLTAASRLALHPSHRLLIPKSQGQPARLLIKRIFNKKKSVIRYLVWKT